MNANDDPSGVNALQNHISKLGYRAQVSNGSVITSAAGMKLAARWFEGSIQLACGISQVPAKFDLEVVNEYNSRYRFATLYRSEDRVVLQSNFLLDVFAPEAPDQLETMLSIYEGLIAELRSTMASKEAESEAEDTGADDEVAADADEGASA